MTSADKHLQSRGRKAEFKEQRQVHCHECYYTLTGDFHLAILLNHFIRYQKVANIIDDFITRENSRNACSLEQSDIAPTEGWFYKSAEELCEDLMHPFKRMKVSELVQALVDRGWVASRFNADEKWKRTKQYRVDLEKVSSDLRSAGFDFPE